MAAPPIFVLFILTSKSTLLLSSSKSTKIYTSLSLSLSPSPSLSFPPQSWLTFILYLPFFTLLTASPLTMDCCSSTSSVCTVNPNLLPGGGFPSPSILGLCAAFQPPPPIILLGPFLIVFQLLLLLLLPFLLRLIIDHPLLNLRWSFPLSINNIFYYLTFKLKPLVLTFFFFNTMAYLFIYVENRKRLPP